MARLYTNENFPFPAVLELRRFGHDVLIMADANQAGQGMSDKEVLEFANAQKKNSDNAESQTFYKAASIISKTLWNCCMLI